MKKNDIILIGAVLLVAIVTALVVFLSGETGAYVVVRVDGEEVGKYSLSQDGEYSLNGGTNILIIENGAAYLIEANCPDHLCIKQGKINKNGQTITCLPNKLTVTVYGEDNDVDLVS